MEPGKEVVDDGKGKEKASADAGGDEREGEQGKSEGIAWFREWCVRPGAEGRWSEDRPEREGKGSSL
ncbi:uncharacterized protein A4U43_C09F1110 [Asparagus officinalis]|uniref:Uncharacterized protein n=1 Tax=Asparagus officinalis TaxID=4686 RepID=A0A5P1E7N2_ASPOF|nr:uncharacterized protein A4U43_C09F1110 [Asparagus officinalis]